MRFNHSLGRRAFLGLFYLSTAGAFAQPTPVVEQTAFLTWHDDPTTTMVAQWIEWGALPAPLPGSAAQAIFDTPRLTGALDIDGRGEDWGIHGLRLDYLAQPNGEWPDPTGFVVAAKLGWTAEGLAVLVEVVDEEATEAADDELWLGDSVELFLGMGLDDPRAAQFILAPGIASTPGIAPTPGTVPGADPEVASEDAGEDVGGVDTPRVRKLSIARASEGMPQDVVVQAASMKTDTGYTVEALIPWSNLDAVPGLGDTFTFQLIVNDRDGVFGREIIAWHPSKDSYQNRRSMQTLRLAEQPDTTVRVQALSRFDAQMQQLVLDLGGEPRLIGERVVIRSGEVELGTVLLENVLGFAGAVLVLPTDGSGVVPRTDAISIHLDDLVVGRSLLSRDLWRTTPEGVSVQVLSDDDNAVLEFESQPVPFGDTGLFLQRVSMTGLGPDREYLLELPGQGDALMFRTAPATLDRPLVFAEGGDVGTARVVEDLHDLAASWNPLFGLVGGDCAYANGVDADKWVDFLRQWHNHMVTPEGHAIPMLATIGNHEVAGGYGKPRENAPFFYAMFGPLFSNRGAYQTLDFGDYLSLILLDSGHTAAHDGQQTKWLAQALAQRDDVPYRFAAYHVPAYPSHRSFDGQHSVAAREHWVPLFDAHRVTAVFEHHDHTYKRTHRLRGGEAHPDGVLYVGDGAWGRTPRSVNADLPYLAVAKSSLNVIRVELSPEGETSYLAVDELGQTLDRYRQPLDSE